MVATSNTSKKRKKHAKAMREAKRKKRMEAEARRQKQNRLREKLEAWEIKIDQLEEALRPFRHARGKLRSEEQNVMVIESVIGLMKDAKVLAEEKEDLSLMNLTNIDFAAASIHKFKKQHITTIRSTLQKKEELIIAFGDNARRGCGSENYDMSIHRILDDDQVKFLYDYIDEQHKEGRTVTNQKLRHTIGCKFGIDIRRSTLQGYLHRMGLSWRPAAPKKKTFKQYRKDAVGQFLIEYSKLLNDPDAIPVYVDESYI